jgi:hypothetical protein
MEDYDETYAESIRHFYTTVTTKLKVSGAAEGVDGKARRDFLKILDEEAIMHEAV